MKFDNFNIIKTISDDEYASVYLVEDIETKEKFIVRQLPTDTSNPLYSTAVFEFKEMSKKFEKLSRRPSSPAIIDVFSEDGSSYLLLEYKSEKSLKDITTYPAIGKILNNRYLIIRGIAGGGFGVVYLCRDTALSGKHLAVKEMLREGPDPSVIERSFRVEAEILSKLEHPSIPGITDFFIEENKLYLVMDYVRGETLKKIITSRPKDEFFSEEEVTKWALSMADVLEYLHNRSDPILFRDIKPDNIMITTEGEVRLIDFGIAKVFAGPGADTTKYALYTEGYAPPEQWAGKAEKRSDIYSLGVTLYHVLTKVHPREVGPHFPPVEKLNPSISQGLSRIINKSIEIKISDRYQSIEEFKRDLLHIRDIKKNREKIDEHLVKGEKYEQTGDLFNANFEYLKALEYDRDNYVILQHVAICCEKLGFIDKSIEHYNRLIKLSLPEDLRKKVMEKLHLLNVIDKETDEDDEKTIMSPSVSYNLPVSLLKQTESPLLHEEVTGGNTVAMEISSPGRKKTFNKGIFLLFIPLFFCGLISIITLNYSNILKHFLSPVPLLSPSPVSIITQTPEITPSPSLEKSNNDMLLAKNYYDKGKYGDALECLTKILKDDPDNIEAGLLLGDTYRKQEKLEDAMEEYKKILTKDPDNQLAHLGLGHIYRKKGLIEDAVREYKKAPDQSAGHNNSGAIYAGQGKIDEAIEEFIMALEIDPSDDRTYVNLGSAYYAKGDWEKSTDYYNKAIGKKPENSEAYYGLGLSYKKKGLYDKATGAFKEFIKLAPKDYKVPDAKKEIDALREF
jgi:serine/threonine protein kinase